MHHIFFLPCLWRRKADSFEWAALCIKNAENVAYLLNFFLALSQVCFAVHVFLILLHVGALPSQEQLHVVNTLWIAAGHYRQHSSLQTCTLYHCRHPYYETKFCTLEERWKNSPCGLITTE